MYGNNQLPFPADRPIIQPMRIDPNNPPFVPNVKTAQWIAPYVRYLSGLMVDMISANAAGPLSMHFFNRMCQNNWANQEFEREVANCADFIYLKTQHIPQPDPGHAFQQLVPLYLEMRTVFEAKICPALWSYVDPVDQPGMQQQCMMFEQEVAAITALRTQGPAGTVGVGQPVNRSMGGYPPPVGMAPAVGGSPMGYPPPVGGIGGAPVGYGQSRAPGGGRDYGNAAPVPAAPPPQAPPAQQYQATAPTPAQSTKPAAPASGTVVEMHAATWRGSEKFPYPIAFNPVTTKMFYNIENGKTIPQPAQSENMGKIDYDRHNIISLFGIPPENLPVVNDNGEIVRELTSAAKAAQAEEESVDTDGNRLEHTMALKAVMTATALETAVQDAKTEMLANIDRKDPPALYQVYVQVYAPVSTDKLEYDLLKRFADSNSYIELREKIRAAAATAPVELISEVSMRFTWLMNHILHKTMSIDPSDLLVDEFTHDLDDLRGLLKSKYSERYLKVFEKDQAERIKSMLLLPDPADESTAPIHNTLIDNMTTPCWDDKGEKPLYTFVGQTVKITFADVVSHDLMVHGLPKVGNILTKQQQPALLEIASQMFKSDNLGQNISRQLLVTKDNRWLEFTEGRVLHDMSGYLVSLVK